MYPGITDADIRATQVHFEQLRAERTAPSSPRVVHMPSHIIAPIRALALPTRLAVASFVSHLHGHPARQVP